MENTVVLLTAAKAREIATDIRNKEIAECLKILMNQIEEEALKGGVFKYVLVKREGRPAGFFDLLTRTFKELGYGITDKGSNGSGCQSYLITW